MPKLPDFVEAMLSPRAYPHRPPSVELVQTQISFVFLAGNYVYKVKKPVDFGFLDYTTLEKRRYFCEREASLNRRLCSDAYLGVVEVVREGDAISVEREGEVLEYAVKMRRLPSERMMDRLLRENQVSAEMVERVAERLADFHQRAETNEEIASYGSLGIAAKNTQENFAQTEKYIGTSISEAYYRRIKAYTERFLRDNALLFERRRRGGKIRDCHGDVHSAHVCFTDGICIYDCIEFNERFRYADVAGDVSFLAMDLDYHRRPDLSRHFVNCYVEGSGDKEALALMDFYKCYRAYVRGKVTCFALDDPHISAADKARLVGTARRYFELAHSYAVRPQRPTLFITTGLIGTGKTTVAQALGESLGIEVVSSDLVRKKLAGLEPTLHRYEGFAGGIYSPDFSRMTYDELFEAAKEILGKGQSLILDASFRKAEERRRAMEVARETGADFKLIECVLEEGALKQRLKARYEAGASPSDGRLEIFDELKKDFEPVTEVPPANHLMVNTAAPAAEAVSHLLDRLQG